MKYCGFFVFFRIKTQYNVKKTRRTPETDMRLKLILFNQMFSNPLKPLKIFSV